MSRFGRKVSLYSRWLFLSCMYFLRSLLYHDGFSLLFKVERPWTTRVFEVLPSFPNSSSPGLVVATGIFNAISHDLSLWKSSAAGFWFGLSFLFSDASSSRSDSLLFFVNPKVHLLLDRLRRDLFHSLLLPETKLWRSTRRSEELSTRTR